MRSLAALVGRSLAGHRAIILGLAGVLAGFQLLMIQIAINLEREGLFSAIAAFLPSYVVQGLGGAVFSSFATFAGFGFFHPVVVTSLAAVAAYLASDSAAEVEDGLVDVVAARPIPRHLLVTRSAIVSCGGTLAIVLLMFAASRGGAAWMRPPGVAAQSGARTFLLACNLLAVAWCFASAGVAAAAVARRRATAAGAMAFSAVLLYLLHFVAGAWSRARPFGRLSPFHYYDGMGILVGMKDPTRDIAILLVVSAVCLAIAYVAFERRDL